MRIVQFITATAIALGSTTAAFAASPTAQVSPALYGLSQTDLTANHAGTSAEVIKVSGKKHYKKFKRQRHHKNKSARHHKRHHEYRSERYYYESDKRHRSSKKDTAKILGLLGAAAILANRN